MDATRVYDQYELPLGTVLISTRDRCRWVFIGWGHTTKGPTANFIQEVTPIPYYPGNHGSPPWRYSVALSPTLEKIFPESKQFRKPVQSIAS